jgi:hypothetical protein
VSFCQVSRVKAFFSAVIVFSFFLMTAPDNDNVKMRVAPGWLGQFVTPGRLAKMRETRNVGLVASLFYSYFFN